MASYCEVFERTEKKYRLDACQHRSMLAALAGRMEPDVFGVTRITSLYFDTPDRLLIERSLDKPLYKEKLRLRRYGDAQGDDGCVFVEIKKKFRGVVYKRRVGLSPAAARAYWGGMPYAQACARFPLADAALDAESKSARSLQIAREIDQFRKRYGRLVPSMDIRCRRSAYAPLDPDDGELRITFDEGISYRDRFARHAAARELLAPGEVVMEVKNAGPWPLWLSHALTACGAYPSSFSKYGEAYRACMRADGAAGVPVPAAAAHADVTADVNAGTGTRRVSVPAAEPAHASASAASICAAVAPSRAAEPDHAVAPAHAGAAATPRKPTSKERVLDCA